MVSVSIDTCVIVASEIPKEDHYKESKRFMNFVLENKNKNLEFFTSIFTFVELASAMIRRTSNKDKAYSLLYRVTKSWKNSINPLPLIYNSKSRSQKEFSKDFIDDLIEIAIRFKTKSGDTMQANAIAENQIDYFITWNKKDFREIENKLKNLHVLDPLEFLKEVKSEKFIKLVNKKSQKK